MTDAIAQRAGRRAPVPPVFRLSLLWQALGRLAHALLVLAACLSLFSTPAVRAHDVPAEFRAHVFVKPEAERLQVLVRIPLSLLLNIDLPKKGPGYIDLAQAEAGMQRATRAVDNMLVLHEDRRRLTSSVSKSRISLPSDRSFERFDAARDAIQGPRLADDAYVFWNQGYFDVLLEYVIQSDKSAFALNFNVAPGLRDRLKYDLRYIDAGGRVHAYDLSGASDMVALDPRWYQAASTFMQSGFQHILDGPDHLLFLLCLILPFRRIDWNLAGVITAFTVGHSVTLIAAAYGIAPSGAWFAASVEFLIAASILYMAIENVLVPRLTRRWLYSGLFGLVHGFGFSFMLQSQLQFAGSHLLLSLLAFNVGIEIGQMLVLVTMMSLLGLVYRARDGSHRAITLVICLLVGHAAWHWMAERGDVMRKADWSGVVEPYAGAGPVLWLGLALVSLVGVGYFLFRFHGRQPRA